MGYKVGTLDLYPLVFYALRKCPCATTNCRPRFVGLAARPRAATRHAKHGRAGGARPLPFRPRARAVGTGSAGCAGLSRLSRVCHTSSTAHRNPASARPPTKRGRRTQAKASNPHKSQGGAVRRPCSRPLLLTPTGNFSAPVSARPSRRPLSGAAYGRP